MQQTVVSPFIVATTRLSILFIYLVYGYTALGLGIITARVYTGNKNPLIFKALLLANFLLLVSATIFSTISLYDTFNIWMNQTGYGQIAISAPATPEAIQVISLTTFFAWGIVPQLLWLRRVRTSLYSLWLMPLLLAPIIGWQLYWQFAIL